MGDRYRPDERRDYRDHYDSYPRRASPPRRTHDNNDSGFTFRGAANDNHAPPPPRRAEENFSFQAGGPPAPRFEPSNAPPNKNRDRRNDRGRGRGRGRGQFRGRGGRGFLPRPAHSRDLLKNNDRATTPELMEGMNEGAKSQYIEYVSSSEDDADAASTGGDLADDAPLHKRARTGVDAAAADSVPKWSNPDPYTVLPPTDFSVAPKKDIVQTIRKAKVEAAAQNASTNAIKENADFISFDDLQEDEEEEEIEQDDYEDILQETHHQADRPHMSPPVAQPEAHEPHDSSRSEGEIDEDGEMAEPPCVDLGFAITPKFGNEPSSSSTFPPPAPPSNVVEALQDEEMDDAVVATRLVAGTKRKRRDKHSNDSAGYIVEEWQEDGTNPTPWHEGTGTFTAYVGLQLHKEILAFYNFVRPTDYEERCRLDLIARVDRTLKTWRGNPNEVSIKSFGSFASNLYLPNSDMDLVAVSESYLQGGRQVFCQSKNQMRQLQFYLERSGIAAHGTVTGILGAKVPIIKFIDAKTGLKVDISFENDSGLRAIETFEAWKEQFPEMPVLVTIIKQFLLMRNMNEVHTGGIGGFTIICLVVSMLQLKPPSDRAMSDIEGRYGELLLNFLDLYGNKFILGNVGIELNPPRYMDKYTYRGRAKINATGLTIIDPNRPENDISGGSKRVGEIFGFFRSALSLIQKRLHQFSKDKDPETSILGCILGGSYTSFFSQRDRLLIAARDIKPGRDERGPPAREEREPPPRDSYQREPSPYARGDRHAELRRRDARYETGYEAENSYRPARNVSRDYHERDNEDLYQDRDPYRSNRRSRSPPPWQRPQHNNAPLPPSYMQQQMYPRGQGRPPQGPPRGQQHGYNNVSPPNYNHVPPPMQHALPQRLPSGVNPGNTGYHGSGYNQGDSLPRPLPAASGSHSRKKGKNKKQKTSGLQGNPIDLT
ncbi:unnamed protein product [Zymoseptoria tritici ST99CH_1A5]|uniref:polynucleotide adenylyltransferase n=1 Tax=Zymoseptoria tritici ST99CH_1A5 TaxID=1276529 RepID=A0A1Y6LCD8_ZYMTR|nr:unnamed protein product [Zymoseptoria tritici ST99CH_1A5]